MGDVWKLESVRWVNVFDALRETEEFVSSFNW